MNIYLVIDEGHEYYVLADDYSDAEYKYSIYIQKETGCLSDEVDKPKSITLVADKDDVIK